MTNDHTDDNSLLCSSTAERLYFEHAATVPIVDFGCRLSAEEILRDRKWNNIAELWLNDPCKWRVMRTAGIDERYCTEPETDPKERFERWAEALQSALCNPISDLAAAELKNVFGIDRRLTPSNAQEIYDECNARLTDGDFSSRGLLRRQNVKTLCTQNDPVESLEYHILLAKEPFETKVLPSWQPDAAMAVEDPSAYKAYVAKLGAVAGVEIHSFDDLIEALQVRHNFFASTGCRISLHRTEELYAEEFTRKEIERLFRRVCKGRGALSVDEVRRFKSAMMVELSSMDWCAGWSQIFCYGAMSDLNSRRFAQAGRGTGFDAVNGRTSAEEIAHLLDRFDSDDHLCRTVLCNLNPQQTEFAALLAGAFQDGRYGAGKVQAAAWNNLFGSTTQIEHRLRTIASTGVLGRSVGCASEAETLLGFSRHDYFRRTLCRVLGGDLENGTLPASETEQVGAMVENICAANAEDFFGI